MQPAQMRFAEQGERRDRIRGGLCKPESRVERLGIHPNYFLDKISTKSGHYSDLGSRVPRFGHPLLFSGPFITLRTGHYRLLELVERYGVLLNNNQRF